jgi:hypothetical protein
MNGENPEELLARPIVVTITSAIVFLLGLFITVSSIIVAMALPYVSLSSIYVIVTIVGLVVGTLLVSASYNLWKMKKWAAQLAAIIILSDLISTPFIRVSASLGIGISDILAWIADIIILVLIALSLKTLTMDPPK